MKIGFIGLGVMGVPMAGHLVGAGHSICTSLNRSGLPEELKSRDVEILDSPADVAECCDTIITMLPDSPDVESIGNINTLFSLIPPHPERKILTTPSSPGTPETCLGRRPAQVSD